MKKINLQLFASSYTKTEQESTTTSNTTGGSKTHTKTNNAAGEVDKETEEKYNQYKQGYEESQNVKDAYKYLQDTLGKQPGAFESDYKGALDNLYSQVVGREKFTYDMNTDILYQQYKDQYMRAGNKAMQDTLGQASALTGGYDNSYAQSVAQQTYQGYLGELNNRIPELYQMAFDRYQQEGNDLYQQFSMASDLYGKEYAQYRDQVADWQADRGYATDMYQSERDFDYNDYQTMLNLYQNEYWNQRHAVSESDTESSNWSNTTSHTSSTSTSKSSSSGSGGSGGSGGEAPGDVDFVGSYDEAQKYMEDHGLDASSLLIPGEYAKDQNLRMKYGEGYQGYINYINDMCGI